MSEKLDKKCGHSDVVLPQLRIELPVAEKGRIVSVDESHDHDRTLLLSSVEESRYVKRRAAQIEVDIDTDKASLAPTVFDKDALEHDQVDIVRLWAKPDYSKRM